MESIHEEQADSIIQSQFKTAERAEYKQVPDACHCIIFQDERSMLLTGCSDRLLLFHCNVDSVKSISLDRVNNNIICRELKFECLRDLNIRFQFLDVPIDESLVLVLHMEDPYRTMVIKFGDTSMAFSAMFRS